MRRSFNLLMGISIGIVLALILEILGQGFQVAALISGIAIGILISRYLDLIIAAIVSPMLWYAFPLALVLLDSNGFKLLNLIAQIAGLSSSILLALALLSVILIVVLSALVTRILISILKKSRQR